MLKRRLNRLIKADLQSSSLKQKVVRGALWTISGNGMNQALRLVANLILTRLLFPEAFGLMALTNGPIDGILVYDFSTPLSWFRFIQYAAPATVHAVGEGVLVRSE